MANILIDAGHPAHVHLFRNAARRWEAQGHRILFSALDREMILHLLDHYDLPYTTTYRRRQGKLALAVELLARTWTTFHIARRFRADLLISFGSPTVGVPARLLGKPYIALTDTDHAVGQHALFKPLATVIATPTVFQRDLGPRHIRYPAFHELAYLHPDEFTPDPAVLREIGLTPEDRYFVVRFVAWEASHDVGHHGFSPAQKRALLEKLAAAGRVLLSVEGDVPADLRGFVTQFPPEKIHHYLAFATAYIGEGATMASEAALLGTPSLYVSTLVSGLSYIADLQRTYRLLLTAEQGDDALAQVDDLLAMPDPRQTWADRRARMLADKIDPTPWLARLGERLLENPRATVEDLQAL